MTEDIFDKAKAILAVKTEADALFHAIHEANSEDAELLANLEKVALVLRGKLNQTFVPLERLKDRIEGMEADLLANLDGVTDAEKDGIVIRVKQAGGVQAVELEPQYKKEPAKLPERFHKRKIEPDNEAIRAALVEGEDLGDIAKLLPRKRILVIEVAE